MLKISSEKAKKKKKKTKTKTNGKSLATSTVLWELKSPPIGLRFPISKAIESMTLTKIAKSRLRSVPLTGTLKQTKDGFVYLKIPNNVINGLFACIDEEDIQKPPYNIGKYKSIGAHISVMHSDELKEKDTEINEIGEHISFKLGKFYSTKPEGWAEMERVWFVTVESPELERLRKKYKLTKKLNGHEFHLTCAVRRKKSGK